MSIAAVLAILKKIVKTGWHMYTKVRGIQTLSKANQVWTAIGDIATISGIIDVLDGPDNEKAFVAKVQSDGSPLAKQYFGSSEALKSTASSQDFANINKAIRSVTKPASSGIHNDPKFWAAAGDKISIFRPHEYSSPQEALTLQGIAFRSVQFQFEDVDSYPDYDTLLPNVKGLSMPQNVSRLFYNAYKSYYDRLSIDAPLSEQVVVRRFGMIMRLSFDALSELMVMLRSQNMKEVTLDGDPGPIAGFIGSKYYAGNLPNGSRAATAGIIPTTGTTTPSEGITGTTANYTFSVPNFINSSDTHNINVNGNGYAEHADKYVRYTKQSQLNPQYANLKISNKDWATLVSAVKSKCCLTQPAAEFVRYLFQDVIMDKAYELDKEAWILFPDNPIDRSSSTSYNTPVDDYNPLTRINTLLDYLEQLYTSDKAFLPVLKYAGMKPISSAQLEWQGWEFKRDIMSKTLQVREASDEFYNALVNADYQMFIKYAFDNNNLPNIVKSYNMKNAAVRNGEFVDMEDYLWFGDYDKIIIKEAGTYTDMPIPTIKDAGSIASALKFQGKVRLIPLSNWIYNGDSWLGALPAFNNAGFRFLSPSDSDPTDNLYSNVNPTNYTTTNIYKYSSYISKYDSLGLYTYSWMAGLDIVLEYDGTNWNATNTRVLMEPGYTLCKAQDLEPIKAFQYLHLFTDLNQLKGMVEKLTALESHFGIGV